MSVPYELKIVPALTFRPLSPVLAQQIANAYRDLAVARLRPAEPTPVAPTTETRPAGSTQTLDQRA
jgi:hypothetical protein